MKDKIIQGQWLDFLANWSGDIAIEVHGHTQIVIGYCRNGVCYRTLEELFWAWYNIENKELLKCKKNQK